MSAKCRRNNKDTGTSEHELERTNARYQIVSEAHCQRENADEYVRDQTKEYTDHYIRVLGKTIWGCEYVKGQDHDHSVLSFAHEDTCSVIGGIVDFWHSLKADASLKDVRLPQSQKHKATSVLTAIGL